MDPLFERGRKHNKLRSLSPPGRALARSKPRSRSRSRSRDASPFSIDSKLATSYVVNNPFSSSSIREPVPIMEDDELDIQMSPMLPQFSKEHTMNNINQVIDSSDLDIMPLSSKKEKEIAKEIYDDFHEQFQKDTELKSNVLKKFKEKEKEKVNEHADGSINRIKHGNVKSSVGSSIKSHRDLDFSSTDYSTDSDVESNGESESNAGKSLSNNKYLRDSNTILSSDHDFRTRPRSKSHVYNLGYHVDSPTDGFSKSIKNTDSNLLISALNQIDHTQSESKPSTILKWINKIPQKLSLGHVLVQNNKDVQSAKCSYLEEGYDLTDFDKRPDDIESNLMKHSGSSNKILKMANNLVHGKSPYKAHNAADFDIILNEINGNANSTKTQNGSMDDEISMKNGLTSNLMKLYNQIPDFSDNDIFSDSDDNDANNENQFEGSSNNIHKKMTKKIKKIKNGVLFSSRESSRGPLTRECMSNSNDGDYNNSTTFTSNSNINLDMNHIKLPDFSLPKKAKNDKIIKKIKKKSKKDKAARITVHIVDLLVRQEFLLTLCKAFMLFGAPNHRLEEYMTLTAKVLEVEATFIYLPGMMLANFSDPVTRTSDLKLVRVGQGLNVSKLDMAHDIYENVVFDRIGVDEASLELDELFKSDDFLSTPWIILFYGLSSMFSLIFFNGAWLDMIPSFILGCILGFWQCVVAPKNAIYSAVFEVGSAILISFISRAVGSIDNGKYFCFSAIVLSGLCMILPGYMILRGALEIQSKSIVSGVVGMFYAIIYSLFLGFGLTLGSALYGWIDRNAYSQTTCSNIGHIGNIWKLLFIPLFNIAISLASQARYHQLSIMVVIACCGYVVVYFSSLHFGLTQLNSALGAFTIGLLSNLYDRWGKSYKRIGYCSTKFSSMICGIFDLVPGGFAARNVLSAGLVQLQNNGNSTATSTTDTGTLTFGISMIEIAIGITVGLFMSTLVVYMLRPRKSESGSSIGL